MNNKSFVVIIQLIVLTALMAVLGCAGRPSVTRNSDPALRKTSAEFAADAAKRFPFKSDAPSGGEAVGRAQVGYTMNVLEIVNLSNEDWDNVEVWVNSAYVVFIPKMQPNKLKKLPFQMLYNDKGTNFPTDNSKVMVDRVQVLMNGKMYEVRKQQAD